MNTQVFLRPLERRDVDGMLEWMRDPEINRWFRFNAAEMTAEKAERFIDGSITETHRHLAVTDETDEYLGTISLEDIDMENGHALFALVLRKCAWGRGIAVISTLKMLEIAFHEIGLERVYMNVLPDNARSKRFCQRAGFRYEGCFRRHLKLRGEWYDWEWYAVLRDEYDAGNH